MPTDHSNRIQTSFLNAAEKKALVWMAEHMPRWITSDFMSTIGFLGAMTVGAGYILSNKDIHWLWLGVFGYVINWLGDSLDGTIARVRKKQRPIYGYYLDHTLDVINEIFMFCGAGLSVMMHNYPIALMVFLVYLMLTLNVSINAHLKGEFKLTYFKMGPTELRIILILVNILFIYVEPLRDFSRVVMVFGQPLSLGPLDCVALFILVFLMITYIVTVIQDLKGYSKIDPMP